MVFFNRQPTGDAANVTITRKQLGYPSDLHVSARDLLGHQDLGSVHHDVEVSVPAGSVLVMRLDPDTHSACESARDCSQQQAAAQRTSRGYGWQAVKTGSSCLPVTGCGGDGRHSMVAQTQRACNHRKSTA